MTQNTKDKLPTYHLLIVAAGRGARLQGNGPKQYLPLAGKPILRHTLETFQSHALCKSTHIVIHPDDAKQCQNLISDLKNVTIGHGAEERNKSVYNGLEGIPNISDKDIILIHDAVRPCISHAEIEALLGSLSDHQAASLATPISGTLTKTDQNTMSGEQIDRSDLWSLQTPQAFRYGDILSAHKNADPQKRYTDDTALVSDAGIPVKLVQGKPTNIKITYPSDLDMAAAILQTSNIRTGQGFDVHAFDDALPGPVRLCGIDIDHPHALKGHSDADVGLHTLTDAILGAIAEGDIGRHFPPSDDTFKDMDSAIFLEKAMELLGDKGGTLINADITIICEAPKIGPHASAMQARIAEICGIAPTQINVKATTTEKLGFTGRGEGITAQAIVSVRLP